MNIQGELMMKTIETLYLECIEFEELVMAHYLLCLIQEGKVQFHDEVSVLRTVEASSVEKVRHLIDKNYLRFCTIKMYEMQVAERKWALVYANSPEEAKDYLWRTRGEKAWDCREPLMDFDIPYDNRRVTYRDLKKEFNKFPCFVRYFENCLRPIA